MPHFPFLNFFLVFLLAFSPFPVFTEEGKSNPEPPIDSQNVKEEQAPILEILKMDRLSALLFLGRPEEFPKSKVETLSGHYCSGLHYRIFSLGFESIINAKTGCIVQYIGRHPEISTTNEKTLGPMSPDEIALAVLRLKFPLFSGLTGAGIHFDEKPISIDPKAGRVEYPRIIADVPVHQESIIYYFQRIDEKKVLPRRISVVVSFVSQPSKPASTLQMEECQQKARQALDSKPYIVRRRAESTKKGEISLSDGRLRFVHRNGLLEDSSVEQKSPLDSTLQLGYVFKIDGPGIFGEIFVDAQTGSLIGGVQIGD